MLKSDVSFKLSREFGDASTDTDLITMFNNWIDEAYQVICGAFSWQHKKGLFDVNVTAGVANVDLDTNIRRIITLQEPSTRRPIIFRSYKDLVADGIDLTATGLIQWWFIREFKSTANRQTSIQLVYVPDVNYTLALEAEKSAVETIAGNEHIPLPSELLPALSCFVRKLSASHESDWESADRWNANYEDLLQKYKMYMEKNPSDPIISRENTDLWFGNRYNMPFLRYPNNITEA